MKIPRTYEIRRTLHVEQRAQSPRAIPLELIDETIRTGREYFTGEIGRRGGKIAEFSKTFVVRRDGHARSKTVVVIGEVVDNVCFAITTFNEEPRI